MSVILRNAKVTVSTSTEEGLHDVSDSVIKVLLAREWESIDTTCVLDTAQKSIAGREDWAFSIDMLQAFSTQSGYESGIRIDTLLNTLAGLTNQNRPFLVQVLVDRDRLRAADNPQYSGLCLLDAYQPMDASVGDLLKVQPEFVGVSELTRDEGRADNAHPVDTLIVQLSEALRTIDGQSFLMEDEGVHLIESATILDIGATISKTTSDSIFIDLLETTILLKDGVVERLTSDALVVQASEGTPIVAIDGTVVLTVADTLEIHLIQEGQIIEKQAAESCVVQITETASIAFAVTVADTVAVQAGEGAVLAATVTEADSLRVASTESEALLTYADIAHLQSRGLTGAGATIALAYTSNNTLGSLLILRLGLDSGSSIASVADTRGNTWVKITGATGGVLIDRQEVWYVKNCAAGANTVTLTMSGVPTFWEFDIFEYSNADLINPLDQASLLDQINPGAGAGAVTSGNVTSTTPKQLIFGATLRTGGSGSSTAVGTGFTLRQNVFGDSPCADKILAARGVTAAIFTSDAADNDFVTSVATFRAKLLP